VEDRQALGVTDPVDELDGTGHAGEFAQAGRHDHRCGGVRDPLQQREEQVVPRRDLVRVDERLEHINAEQVEGRRDEEHAAGARELGKLRPCTYGQLEALQTCKAIRVMCTDVVLSAEGLKLDCIRTRAGGMLDKLTSNRRITLMVVADLGDDNDLLIAVKRTELHRTGEWRGMLSRQERGIW
jgi:hypothetical protein